MDPLSIAASAFSLAGCIAKASFAIIEFSRDARDAAKDLSAVTDELHALSAVLDPIARCLTTTSATTIPEALATQVDSALGGCVAVVEQITENVQKYRQDKIMTKTKWVMFGQSDMQKLRESLEAYKMALGLGMHVITLSVTQAVKEDTTVIRDFAADIKLNTDEILARVNSIKRGGGSGSHKRIEEWIEDMSVLSTYAETTYQGTVADPTERLSHSDSPRRLSMESDSSRDKPVPPLVRLERTLDQLNPQGTPRGTAKGKLSRFDSPQRPSVKSDSPGDKPLTPLAELQVAFAAIALEDQRREEALKHKAASPQSPLDLPRLSAADRRRQRRIERMEAPGLPEQGQSQMADQERHSVQQQTPKEPGKGEEIPEGRSTLFSSTHVVEDGDTNLYLPWQDPASRLFQPSPRFPRGSPPPVAGGQVKGHKRSSTMGEIAGKLYGRHGSLFEGRNRTQDAEQNGKKTKRYPPVDMRSSTPSNESRVSMDSRRSRRSFSIGLGRKRSGSMTGSQTSQERHARRFSFIPTSFSLRAIGIGSDSQHVAQGFNSQETIPIQESPLFEQLVNDAPYGSSGTGGHAEPQSQTYRLNQRGRASSFDGNVTSGIPKAVRDNSTMGTKSYQRDGPFPQQYHQQEVAYEGRRVAGSGTQNQRGVLQKGRRFVDAWDTDPYSRPHDHSGSSGPARRVMDFFRRRGKARGESAHSDSESWT
ncbi:hypothetical protein OQA88_933 [Cercophora sp. LCS_1]